MESKNEIEILKENLNRILNNDELVLLETSDENLNKLQRNLEKANKIYLQMMEECYDQIKYKIHTTVLNVNDTRVPRGIDLPST